MRSFEGGRSRTLTELARLNRLPLSTAYRIVNELVASGALRRTEQGYYVLQSWLAAQDKTRSGGSTVSESTLAVMDDLAVVTRKVVRLGTEHENRVQYVERGPAQSGPLDGADIRPMHATATGKVLLAFGPPTAVEALVSHGLQRFTTRTVTDVDQFLDGLSVTRRTTVAYEWGELDEDSSAIAVAVLGPGRTLLAALEVQTTGESDIRRLEHAVLLAARLLARQLAAD